MRDKLLREERLVVDCLQKYGCLQEEQLLTLLSINGKNREVSERILTGLKKKQIILQGHASNTLRLDCVTAYNPKIGNAFWLLLGIMGDMGPDNHYPAAAPSQIYFLKDGKQYEIVVLGEGEENLLNPIFASRNKVSTDSVDRVTQIIIPHDATKITRLVEVVPEELRETPHVLLAMLTPKAGQAHPEIKTGFVPSLD